MEKYFKFNFYKFTTFTLILLFFAPISFEAFQNEEWLRMIVMGIFSIMGIYGAIETIAKKSSSKQ